MQKQHLIFKPLPCLKLQMDTRCIVFHFWLPSLMVLNFTVPTSIINNTQPLPRNHGWMMMTANVLQDTEEVVTIAHVSSTYFHDEFFQHWNLKNNSDSFSAKETLDKHYCIICICGRVLVCLTVLLLIKRIHTQ